MKNRYASTRAMLEEISERQKKLGLNNEQLARKIGISYVAFHFLQTGRTANPNSVTYRKLKAFLLKNPENPDSIPDIPHPGIVSQARKVCAMCDSYPQVKEDFLSELNCIIRETLQDYGI